jgi:DNA-binding transcriptional regulator YiaG
VSDAPDINKLLAALSDLLSGNFSPLLDAIDRADPGLPLGDAFKAGMEFARARTADVPVPDEAKALLTLLATQPVARQCFRILREGLEITQQEIAEKCGVSVFTVSHWETGTTPLPLEAMKALFDTLSSRASAAPPPAFTGAEIARFRRALHMRQVDFAATLGVSLPTVKYWEKRGNSPIPAVAARRVRDYATREGIDLAKLAA